MPAQYNQFLLTLAFGIPPSAFELAAFRYLCARTTLVSIIVEPIYFVIVRQFSLTLMVRYHHL